MRTWLQAILVLCAFESSAIASETPPEKGVGEGLGLLRKDGWGAAAVANIGSLFANGQYEVLSAGVGLGASYKFNTEKHRYPIELGLFLAPQIRGGEDGNTANSASAIVHVALFKAFGLGAGYVLWRGSEPGEKGGFFRQDFQDSFFATVGYGFTNDVANGD